jgi:L-asparaginase/beta-aspartyl-peptidase (threonine type)
MRIDGSIQMDAAVMASDGRAGAVAAISNVRNPILVARRVMDTPHLMLAGSWAVTFARSLGFLFHDPATEKAREQHEEMVRSFARKTSPAWVRAWRPPESTDTVGAVARDAKGRFAAGSSTGGVSFMLPGRVGDSPIVGAGLFAGPDGAVTATGTGEEIWRVLLCKFVYDRIAGEGVARACDVGLRLFPKSVPVGIIAVGRDGAAHVCNRDMAWWTNQHKNMRTKGASLSSRTMRR